MRRKRHWIPSGVLKAHNKALARRKRAIRRILVSLAGEAPPDRVRALGVLWIAEALGVKVPRSLRGQRGHLVAKLLERAPSAKTWTPVQVGKDTPGHPPRGPV